MVRHRKIFLGVRGCDGARVALLGDAPRDDSLGVDADYGLGLRYRFGVAAYLNRARPEGVDAGEVVDDDGGASGASHVSELLGPAQCTVCSLLDYI